MVSRSITRPIVKSIRLQLVHGIDHFHHGYNNCKIISHCQNLFTLAKPHGMKYKPPASEVLTCHLRNNNFPPWTSYFVKYEDIKNDQRGRSHFNWTIDKVHNYHILRTGCYPYIKYHCTKRPHENLNFEDVFFRIIKILNLGIPCLAYGIAAKYLIKHNENVVTSQGSVVIYYLYEEDKGSMY